MCPPCQSLSADPASLVPTSLLVPSVGFGCVARLRRRVKKSTLPRANDPEKESAARVSRSENKQTDVTRSGKRTRRALSELIRSFLFVGFESFTLVYIILEYNINRSSLGADVTGRCTVMHLAPLIMGTSHSFILTIHLPFVADDDFSSSARRVDGKGLLESLINVHAPDTFGVSGDVGNG